ncbi:uncharacterized protein LOC116414127 isoform X2 [Apis florea]|uniref:uncharacterized protein LOC116414127 isoform X2 n=1 Tax=Apis florea TaxID=7463 RepID=UPI000252B453|nr:uncharacterized protein LOC116414127 isoform X2 [Apis florea]
MSNDVSLLETRDIYEDSAFSNNIPHIVNGSRVKINLIHTSMQVRHSKPRNVKDPSKRFTCEQRVSRVTKSCNRVMVAH